MICGLNEWIQHQHFGFPDLLIKFVVGESNNYYLKSSFKVTSPPINAPFTTHFIHIVN